MSKEIRRASSPQFKKNTRTVRMMTGSMGFDENMGKVNWKAVRLISGIGYKFMPKEKGVRFKKYRLGNVSFEMATPQKLTSKKHHCLCPRRRIRFRKRIIVKGILLNAGSVFRVQGSSAGLLSCS